MEPQAAEEEKLLSPLDSIYEPSCSYLILAKGLVAIPLECGVTAPGPIGPARKLPLGLGLLEVLLLDCLDLPKSTHLPERPPQLLPQPLDASPGLLPEHI